MEWSNYLEDETGIEELQKELQHKSMTSSFVKKVLVPWNLEVDSNTKNGEHRCMMIICAYCGDIGFKLCGKCREVRYCDRECQVAHWKSGHKSRCGLPGAAKEDTEAAVKSSGRRYMLVEPEIEK
jgi:hypothetical protein